MNFTKDNLESIACDKAVNDYRENYASRLDTESRREIFYHNFVDKLIGAVEIGGFIYAFLVPYALNNPQEYKSRDEYFADSMWHFTRTYGWREKMDSSLWIHTIIKGSNLANVECICGEPDKEDYPAHLIFRRLDARDKMMLCLGYEKAKIRFLRWLDGQWQHKSV